MKLNRKTALLLIDAQKNVLKGVGSLGKHAETEALFEETLLRLAQIKQKARTVGMPVIIIQHAGAKGHRLEVGSDGWQIHPLLNLDEKDLVLSKTTSDSFHETELLAVLSKQEITDLVVGGFLTQYCIDLSVRRAVMLGFDVTLISDGHSTCDENGLTCEQIVSHHNNILPIFKLNGHGVSVLPCDSVMAEFSLL